MKKMSLKQACIYLIAVFLFAVLMNVKDVNAAESCYTITPKITDAVKNYLTEMYLNQYPEMGLEFMYGSASDKKILQTLSDVVTKDCATNADKAMAIAKWTARNIKYESMFSDTCYYPIDVLYERKGNCLGYAIFMSQLMRLEGIPAVMCSGVRGNMVEVVTLDYIRNTNNVGHAWVMAYYDNQWHLYDPIFGEYNVTDYDYISKWYFTNDMEGVSPYYEGMDTTIMNGGWTIYYINNRFMSYAGGLPASQYYGMAAEGGKTINNAISYIANTKYGEEYESHDGFYYMENPERKASMINDECYRDGWLNGYLARANGISVANTIRVYNGKTIFLPYHGSYLYLEKSSEEYSLKDGYVCLSIGETIRMIPYFYESELNNGKVFLWQSETPEIATIDSNGVITAVGEGLAILSVCSKDTLDGDTHYGFTYIQVSVVKEKPTISYEDIPVNQENSSGQSGNDTGQDGWVSSEEELTNPVTVTFKPQKGKTKTTKVKLEKGSSLTSIPTCTRKGYTFSGWYTKKSGGTKITKKTVFRKDTTVYAHYKKVSVSKCKSLTLKNKKGYKLQIKFGKISGVKGYQIQYATNNKFKKSVKKTVKTRNQTYKLKKKKTYYVRVRGYKLDSTGAKVYGKWSTVKKIKLKK